MDEGYSGGCQCGRVRFRVDGALGRATICHCRMCQKAFGNFFAPLVTARGLVWTKGEPTRFRSSNKVRRGFCAACGTPMTYEPDGYEAVEVAIATFDDPEVAAPVIQVGVDATLSCFKVLRDLPTLSPEEQAKAAPFYTAIVSYQHPDHDGPAEATP